MTRSQHNLVACAAGVVLLALAGAGVWTLMPPAPKTNAATESPRDRERRDDVYRHIVNVSMPHLRSLCNQEPNANARLACEEKYLALEEKLTKTSYDKLDIRDLIELAKRQYNYRPPQ